MARLTVPHHPERYFKDSSWGNDQKISGYHALGTDNDPLEAFAVELDNDCEPEERVFASQMIALVEPFQRVEMWCEPLGYLVVIGFYHAP